MNRFRKFWALERSDKSLFCESLLLHLSVGLLLKVVPFRHIPALFKSKQFETPEKRKDQFRYDPVPIRSGVSVQQSVIVEKIRAAIQRAGLISPWRNRCLVSSLAARCMLRRRRIGSELSLGVAKDAKGKLLAHAWLKTGDFEIIEKKGNYTELFRF